MTQADTFTDSTPDSTREEMEFDVVIVGAGPAGLGAAIKLKRLNPDRSVCVLEKGAEVGAQIVSGAVMDPHALKELLPDWDISPQGDAPLGTPVSSEKILFLTRNRAIAPPFAAAFAPNLDNRGNYVVSLGDLCRRLGEKAEEMGVEIFPGFTGAGLHVENGRVAGILTGDMGIGRNGKPGPNHMQGMILRGRQIILAEGARGSLSEEAIQRFNLRENATPQTYGLGIKEVWRVPADVHRPGLVQHSFGWPLDSKTYGGGFLYHFGERHVAYGFVTGLDYRNPFLSPFEEMQRLKTHPAFAPHFKDGERIMYAARVISEGGLQSLPKTTFPGGALAGDCAGFLNMARIKGIHTSLKSGMLAAEAVEDALASGNAEPASMLDKFRASWLYRELDAVRNIRPAFAKWGTYGGAFYTACQSLTKGRMPWTLRHETPDRACLKPAAKAKRIDYPAPDHKLTFDRASSLYLSGMAHDEDQPVHLRVASEAAWERGLREFDAPETRYCPAGVYELAEPKNPKNHDERAALRINAANCLQCKTCDIKDPFDNIRWTPPEGGSGPNYPAGM